MATWAVQQEWAATGHKSQPPGGRGSTAFSSEDMLPPANVLVKCIIWRKGSHQFDIPAINVEKSILILRACILK